MSSDDETFPKKDTHVDGHTHRYKRREFFDSNNYVLTADRKYSSEVIPLSEIDDFFPNNINLTTYSCGEEKPLNSQEQWEQVEKTLEEKSIKTTKKWEPFDGVVTKTYSIPVNRYLLKKTTAPVEFTWLKWNNQYYDPTYIYSYVGEDDTRGTLKNYCSSEWVDPEIPNHKILYKKIFNEVKSNKKLLQTKSCYWEIDLGSVQDISHIVTFGKYPQTRLFPMFKNYTNYVNYVRNNNTKTFIKVLLNNRDESYVKKFTVSFKSPHTQKWIGYKEFDANLNPYTPKTNELNIKSRYVRIKPIDSVGSRSIIINLYGPDMAKVTKRKNIKNENEDEDEEIIKYTLTPPNLSKKRNDGCGERCISPEWRYGQYHKNERRKQMNKLIKQQQDSLYGNSDDEN